ncbi:hypothetical protein B296_00001193, partial [Ensete ventricosum]
PQGDHIELHRKRHGYRLDHFERKRKKEAREVHKRFGYQRKNVCQEALCGEGTDEENVRPVAEDEMFRVIRSGKRKTKQWKRMVTKVTFVGQGFTRKPPKYERFIRPTGLRFTKAHVTHPELKCTFNLEIIGIKKNPNGPMYTSLGVVTKGTIIEVSDTTGDDMLHMLRTALCLPRLITN